MRKRRNAVRSLWARRIKNGVFLGFVIFFCTLVFVPLTSILGTIVVKGAPQVSVALFTHLPKPVGETGGGIANAILGTVLIVSLAAVIGVPLGVLGGVYLSESKTGILPSVLRLSVEVLQGTPSIVIGIIAYTWVVLPMHGFSAISGSIALAIMTLPIITRATEETLNLVPHSLKEASIALGVPYHRTILKVILPAGKSGIMTGILIAIARVSGEAAPLLFTAFGSPFLSAHLGKPIASLPLVIFTYATSPYDDWIRQAWGASFVLLVMILLLNVIAKRFVKE